MLLRQIFPCILLVLFAVLDAPLHAQTPTTTLSSPVLQSCIMGTDPGVWASLKLTPDQLERVKRVQEACLEECEAAGATKATSSSISSADGSTVVAELKNVLSADQYDAWLAWCSEHTSTPAEGK